MSSSRAELSLTPAKGVRFDQGVLIVDLADGRSLTVPLEWHPRLAHGSEVERANWVLVANGHGIQCTILDEELSVPDLLAGRRSAESAESLERWLAWRRNAEA